MSIFLGFSLLFFYFFFLLLVCGRWQKRKRCRRYCSKRRRRRRRRCRESGRADGGGVFTLFPSTPAFPRVCVVVVSASLHRLFLGGEHGYRSHRLRRRSPLLPRHQRRRRLLRVTHQRMVGLWDTKKIANVGRRKRGRPRRSKGERRWSQGWCVKQGRTFQRRHRYRRREGGMASYTQWLKDDNKCNTQQKEIFHTQHP